MITVYHITERHSWGEQEIATVLDRERADAYCASRPDHFVTSEDMDEDLAFAIAE